MMDRRKAFDPSRFFIFCGTSWDRPMTLPRRSSSTLPQGSLAVPPFLKPQSVMTFGAHSFPFLTILSMYLPAHVEDPQIRPGSIPDHLHRSRDRWTNGWEAHPRMAPMHTSRLHAQHSTPLHLHRAISMVHHLGRNPTAMHPSRSQLQVPWRSLHRRCQTRRGAGCRVVLCDSDVSIARVV